MKTEKTDSGASVVSSPLLDAIPSNWCDPLLTGPEAALHGKGGTWGCPDIERLLNGVRERLKAALMSNPNFQAGGTL